MSSLRDQFEMWVIAHPRDKGLSRVRKYPSVPVSVSDAYADQAVELAWQAFQAGHAANTVNADLLELCEALLRFARSEANCDTVAILHPSTSVDWHKGHRAALHLMGDKIETAIKKARGEA